jgi:hypothetical protein
MKLTLKVILYGYLLLFFALIINFLSTKIGLTSWYDFLKADGIYGTSTLNLFWLFLVYPIFLGLAVYISNLITKKFAKLDDKKILIILTSFFLILVSLIFVLHGQQKVNVESINSFEECQDAGFPIAESFPEQCILPDGRSFTRELRDDEVVCTMDVKECPDGSFVGRVPPDCEFSPCPGE